jgi:hypothetical protein
LIYYALGVEYDRDTIRIPSGVGISGSGTTNYVSKWTGATSQGNSLIFDDGSTVGIGTTTPFARFDVRGIGSTVSTASVHISNSVGNVTMNVKDNGWVGIGKYPQCLLDLSGSNPEFRFNNTGSGIGNFAQITLKHQAGDRVWWYWNESTLANTFWSDGPSNTGKFLFRSGANDLAMSIDADGRMGINTDTPNASAMLDISTTARGFLPPRMTTAQRDAIATPANGLIVFCTDCTATDGSTGVSQTYSSSTWRNHY